ncbi:Capsular polysaccharide biosynthesis protein [Virgibacillus subterraneus]|uniref:Capsular polysaccharide biosynthesis protein n=2 Tax=Virgibacillus TaxID=84406 RepID=A0A1H0Y2W9_9BACI|nr:MULTISPECIES: Wzz/FepE/Etk N-terminal domain-containing protein [Virgibacillus]SDQ09411.1 Capsular polysaccharide biosynthesis protein [Virgibacillus salinus]SEP66616.1 Capsular polysaccharide biosynthesis protein [Virgibacillus subterraneus]
MSRLKQNRYIDRRTAKEVNLKDFFILIKKRFWIIALITVITTLAGHFYISANSTPIYNTSTDVIIGPEAESMSTIMVMVTDSIVMNMVKEDLGLSQSSGNIKSQIEVQRVEDSQIINISVTNTDPQLAAAIADSTAVAFKSRVANILNFNDVQILNEAMVNATPINGGQNKTVIIAFVFGIIAGTGLVFLLDSMDDTINKELEIEEVLGVHVLGTVSNMNKKKLTAQQTKHKQLEIRGETVDVK